MKTEFQAKFLHHLANKKTKQNKGFTLIELLVVVIIIGVLAAVALPNLLRQVGKAREAEMKNAVGTINRAEQAFHVERQAFTADQGALGVQLDNKFIDKLPIAVAADGSSATVTPENDAYVKDGTRAYSGGVFYEAKDGTYAQTVCQSENEAKSIAAPTGKAACKEGNEIK